LENLLFENLLDGLFEGNELMPIFQERARQEEADIYALNRKGNLFIFELKRATAGGDAVHQVLRYCETAAHWSYDKLQRLYSVHRGGDDVDLQAEHQANFELEVPLPHDRFMLASHSGMFRSKNGRGFERPCRNIAISTPSQ
jgi:hypothetical protein